MLKNKWNLILCLIPYSLRLFENCDAVLMAYEEDPDAQRGAADVICGTLNPRGILPVTASAHFKEGLQLSY